MPATLDALAIALLFVVPGVLLALGVESRIPYRRVPVADRALRFLAGSAALHVLAAPLTFWLWRTYLRVPDEVARRSRIPWPLWIGLAVYLVVPFALGWVFGTWVGRRHRQPSWAGRGPAPKAWDYVFAGAEHSGWVRIKLTDGTWVAGLWTDPGGTDLAGYASSFPHPEDLYLPMQVEVDATTGEIRLDKDGNARMRRWALLVERAHIQLIEFQPELPRSGNEQ